MLDDAAGRRTVRHLLLAAFLPETGENRVPDGRRRRSREG